MPQWIHDRARHIQSKNPSMPESEAFAIATQQAHATGNSPKGYGTAKARKKAKKKYPTPGDDEQQAKPTEKKAMLSIMKDAFLDELEKIAEDEKKKSPKDKRQESSIKAIRGGLVTGGSYLGNRLSNELFQAQLGKENNPLYESIKANRPEGLKIEERPIRTILGEKIGPHHFGGSNRPFAQHFGDLGEEYVATDAAKNPAVLAHEIGHADVNRSALGRAIQNPLTMRVGRHAGNIGAVSGLLSGFSDNEHIQRAGLAAPVLASLPQLGYEAAATVHGLRRMRGAGGSVKDLAHGMKALGPGFASYLANSGIGLGNAMSTQGTVGVMRANHQTAKARQEKKEPKEKAE